MSNASLGGTANQENKAVWEHDKELYSGNGTSDSPYIVDWRDGDPANPYNWTRRKKWLITSHLASCTFAVSFCSSSYSGGLANMAQDLHVSQDIVVLGISLYVLGFGLGPLVFAPLGETYGRRIIFLITLSVFTLTHLAGALGNSIEILLLFRLLSGIFGSSPLTNAGGTISDIWEPRDRGIASALYSTAPWLGPVFGPIAGGFISETPKLGWRFNFWLMLIISAFTLVFGAIVTPETYGPVLLRRRAKELSKTSGGALVYASKYDVGETRSFKKTMQTALSRPGLFFCTEPIVTMVAIYVAIIYGILYALFAAFPIVFQMHRGFTPGQSGLTFLGVGVGVVAGTWTAPIQNRIYLRAANQSPTGRAPPEERLHLAMVGGVLTPVSLFWFAWTTNPSIHWIVPTLAGVPFGMGAAQIMQTCQIYLMDVMGRYFASALAATIVLRSLFAAGFPAFSGRMFDRLGDSWAMSLFGFFSLLCAPSPYLLKIYGARIRSRSKFAWKESEAYSSGSNTA